MSGGEPFLYPEFVDLCARLTKNHFITVNTNLSTSNTIDFADSINPEQTYSINASLHIEEREMRNGLSKYLERVRYYQNKGFQIRVEYVMYPTLFQRIEDDLQMLKSEGVAIVNLKAFRGYFKSRYYPLAYSETEQEFIREHLLDGKEEEIMSIDKTFTFFGKPCRTGLDYWVMDPAGNVRRCCSSTKSYGNFFDESFQADREARPCPFIKCAAPYEGMLYSSDTPVRTTSAIKECFLEAPSYIFQKARPSKLYRYVKKVTSR